MPKANHPEDSRLIAGVQRFQPILCKAKLAGKNESDTVTIIVDMLSEVFGFDKYEQITSELQIKRTFCESDNAISIHALREEGDGHSATLRSRSMGKSAS